jgi:hypothetical protein
MSRPVYCAMKLTGAVSLLVALTACSPKQPTSPASNPAPKSVNQERKGEAYKAAMRNVGAQIQNNPSYSRIELNTIEEKRWFTDLTFRLWNRDISKNTFVDQGLKRYPTHIYEFEYIADRLLEQ